LEAIALSDRFRPLAAQQLFAWAFTELAARDSVFGIPRRHFFVPSNSDPFRTSAFGQPLETPFGPAAGPHTQMAQNIVAAWLCGARYIELKTVQTLDELDIPKPCIDMEDEGYNVEWSQELKVHESFDEYLRAWVLIHALHHALGFPGDSPGVVFNLSVGYDLAGIRKPNVSWFLDQARDCSAYRQQIVELAAAHYPAVRDLPIPDRLSDNVTLSTMHGCPPKEIGRICEYLMRERGLHTYVKCNPTLLGPKRVRRILNEDLGYIDVTVPDEAFDHDLGWDAAIPLLRGLQSVAGECGLDFGVKLSNTLEVENWRTVFDATEKMMYLSGRPLHAVTGNLAADLSAEFAGTLPMSFSAGADCFNAPQLLAAGMQTVTACSDLLKTGGYLRLLQYVENTRRAFRTAGASNPREFILNSARGAGPNLTVEDAGCANLAAYAAGLGDARPLRKETFLTSHSKTGRELGMFDCIEAPCTDACAVNQKVPRYMDAVRKGDFAEALRLTRADNPIPVLLARTCDHLCEPACIRTHLDEPLAIRHVKRFIMEQEGSPVAAKPRKLPRKVAVIGAGPGGLAAASELARAGVQVEVFEQHGYAGGMVGGAIPEYRLPKGVIDRDLAILKQLGVRIHFHRSAGRDFMLGDLRRQGFDNVIIAVGAQLGKTLGLAGDDCEGVLDALEFLRRSREGRPGKIGPRIGIIGAGDTAMDCARTAWRLAGDDVSIIYRRSLEQMPADREEIRCLLEEGIAVTGMAKPQRLLVADGRLRGLLCRRMEYRGDRDATGRKIPHELPGEEFEVPLDTLILAISQHAVLDFFADEPVEVNARGYIAADPVTFETSVPGVYAGGDVVNDGPASIVEAAADGKAIARSILGRAGDPDRPTAVPSFDPTDLIRRRSHRAWRVPVPHTPPEERRNFNEVVLGYDEEQARREAARCLDCDAYCSVCVGVCPNLAMQTLRTEPFTAELPELRMVAGQIEVTPGRTFSINQGFQVVVLTDFCNECGNCTTFCPTAGEPYRDKPRLYRDRAEFESRNDNAFMVTGTGGDWSIESRWGGQTHRLTLGEDMHYRGPDFHARLEPGTFRIASIEAAAATCEPERLTLEPCAVMVALLLGLRRSLPHLPLGRAANDWRIGHPGYPE
jgi:putative selenate reductase